MNAIKKTNIQNAIPNINMNKTIPNTLILYYFCCFNTVKLINKTNKQTIWTTESKKIQWVK
jgi:hypothetical protein